jgi:hypothetical protein
VPAHDVVHGEGGYTSFVLDPPGFPQLVMKLENGHFSAPGSFLTEDLTWLREGDRVSGTIGSDGRSLDSLRGSLTDRMRYTFVGWAEDITRQPDGSTRFRIVFPPNPERIWHPGRPGAAGGDPPAREKVRWKDGRPYRMREGSELTVVIDPDGGPPTVYHETYG